MLNFISLKVNGKLSTILEFVGTGLNDLTHREVRDGADGKLTRNSIPALNVIYIPCHNIKEQRNIPGDIINLPTMSTEK
jgi:hypothetical protein